MGSIFNVFPLPLLPLLAYNILVFPAGSGAAARELIKRDLFVFQMPSTEIVDGTLVRVSMGFSVGHLFIAASMTLIFIELLKSTSTGTTAIFNHALSMLMFLVALVELLMHPAFATASFFVITLTLLLDVLAGVIVTIVSARRDVEFANR